MDVLAYYDKRINLLNMQIGNSTDIYDTKIRKRELTILEGLKDYSRYYFYSALLMKDCDEYKKYRKNELLKARIGLNVKRASIKEEYMLFKNDHAEELRNGQYFAFLSNAQELYNRYTEEIKNIIDCENSYNGLDKDGLEKKLNAEFANIDFSSIMQNKKSQIYPYDMAIYDAMQTSKGISELISVLNKVKSIEDMQNKRSVKICKPNYNLPFLNQYLEKNQYLSDSGELCLNEAQLKRIYAYLSKIEGNLIFDNEPFVKRVNRKSLLEIHNAKIHDFTECYHLFITYKDLIDEKAFNWYQGVYNNYMKATNKLFYTKANQEQLNIYEDTLISLAKKLKQELILNINKKYQEIIKIVDYEYSIYPTNFQNISDNYDLINEKMILAKECLRKFLQNCSVGLSDLHDTYTKQIHDVQDLLNKVFPYNISVEDIKKLNFPEMLDSYNKIFMGLEIKNMENEIDFDIDTSLLAKTKSKKLTLK